MSFYSFILAHYNLFVTSTEAVASSKWLLIQMPGSIPRWVESSKLQRANGPFGPLPLADMFTNLWWAKSSVNYENRKTPCEAMFCYTEYRELRTVIWSPRGKRMVSKTSITTEFTKQSEGRWITGNYRKFNNSYLVNLHTSCNQKLLELPLEGKANLYRI